MSARPLTKDEVPSDFLVDLNRQKVTKWADGRTRWIILATCRLCKRKRWVAVHNIRYKLTKSSICRSCYLKRPTTQLRPLSPEEMPNGPNAIIYYSQHRLEREPSRQAKQHLRVLVECPDCHKQRWIRVNSLRNKKIKSTLCLPCSKRSKLRSHPMIKGGIQITNGYREINVRKFSLEDQELIRQHFKTKERRYVYEHRFVAFKKFGPSALLPGVVVRHIDGNKLNNSPDNLILGTQSDNARDHVTAIAEMKQWRNLAVALLLMFAKIGPHAKTL